MALMPPVSAISGIVASAGRQAQSELAPDEPRHFG